MQRMPNICIALKSVYGKSQYVIGCKLFSSYRAVFVLAQGLLDSKTSDLNHFCVIPHHGANFLGLGMTHLKI